MTFLNVNHYRSGDKNKTTLQVVKELTKNKDLQTIFTYCWGDYGNLLFTEYCNLNEIYRTFYDSIIKILMHYIGTIPSKSHFSMQSALVAHFEHGGFYPIGGASEIAFNMIPVIG